jgi:hypothetical protein
MLKQPCCVAMNFSMKEFSIPPDFTNTNQAKERIKFRRYK